MGWKEFIAEMAQATAWPMTILFILFVWRDKLAGMISRLLKVKYGDAELEFSKGMEKIGDKAHALPQNAQLSDENVNEKIRLKKLASIAPRSAIQQAWNVLDRSITDFLVARHVQPIEDSIPRSEVITQLKQVGLNQHDLNSMLELRSVRNATAHDGPLEIPIGDVDSYVDLAVILADKIKKKMSYGANP